MTRRERLASVAELLARKPFHGNTMGLKSNLAPLIAHFPKGPPGEFEGKWCAAFAYHCCHHAGIHFPARYPSPAPCSFGGVRAWLVWAKLPGNGFYTSARNSRYRPRRGDIVIYDGVFDPGPHDHIGVVLRMNADELTVAEGNVNNVSAVVKRPRDRHIRGFIRIPDGYRYS